MKKTAIILTLCMLASLAGCGKIDSSEESKPLNIQKATVNTEDDDESESVSSVEGSVTVTSASESTAEIIHLTTAVYTSVSTAQKGTVVFAKRSTYSIIPPSKGTVVVPTASTVPKTTITTTTKKKKTTSTTTVTTTTTTTEATTTTTAVNPADVTNGDITCKVQENGIEIIRDGKTIQFIEVDTEQMMSFYGEDLFDPSTLINIEDFDFDGYDDLFIPQEIGANNTTGIYMHYNPETEAFENWEEMADILFYGWTEKDQTFHTYAKDSAFENITNVYVWNEEKQLVLTESRVQYKPDDTSEFDIYVDYFEYPNGEKKLVKRTRLILDDNQELIGEEEIPFDDEPEE